MEFHFKTCKDKLIIFCCDPNDINTITFENVMELCQQNKIEWKNQTYTQFIYELRNNFFDALNGRIKFTNGERQKIAKRFGFKCNICKCCIKDKPFDIDHVRKWWDQ